MTATVFRGGAGIATHPAGAQPEMLLELYDFEGCPHCRLVREVLTELDLDARIYPCPKGGKLFRAKVLELGGKTQFPFLVDANTRTQMYEAADIIRYLYSTYAARQRPWYWRIIEIQRLLSIIAGLPRLGSGSRARPRSAGPPAHPLELYSFEANPFARPVRDVLCVLELPYILRSTGCPAWGASATDPAPGSRNRARLQARAGEISIPYLIDPNTSTQMKESADIIRYLLRTYGQTENGQTKK